MATGELAETLDDRYVRVGEWDLHVLASREPVAREQHVVFLAGFLVGGHSAVPLAAELAKHYRLWAPDLPGYGDSAKPKKTLSQAEQADVVALMLDALAIPSAALIANSYSAQIAVEFAVRHPARLNRLVLISPAVDRRARTPVHQLVRFLKNSREEDAIVPGMVQDYLAVGIRRIAATARYALRYHIEERLPKIEAPTLVVHPSNDRIVPRAWAEEIAKLAPNAHLLEIPGYAHGVERVGVPVLAPLLRRFIDEADRTWIREREAA